MLPSFLVVELRAILDSLTVIPDHWLFERTDLIGIHLPAAPAPGKKWPRRWLQRSH
jgi:hypothetical protein